MNQRPDGLAPYAADASRPGPRAVAEPEPLRRTAFQRDRDRLVHSVAFRRLAQKTQVLMPEEGGPHRTRLTHTLEVAQIARSLARALGLDEDLAEALSLAHDFGHGPFGHTGEDAIDRALAGHGGFDHNLQSLRIVIELERRYLDFDGLNLTWTTLEGLAKRKGPCAAPSAMLRHYADRLGLQLHLHAGAEAQIAALADDIAYNAHDLEDGLLAGFFTIGDLEAVPLLAGISREIARHCPVGREERLPFALARRLIDRFVADAFAETASWLQEAAPDSIEAVRHLGRPIAGLSPAMAEADAAIKAFLFARMYRHPRLVRRRRQAAELVERVTVAFLEQPDRLPAPWAQRAAEAAPAATGRVIGDYVSGLTDRQALAEAARLFDAPPEFV